MTLQAKHLFNATILFVSCATIAVADPGFTLLSWADGYRGKDDNGARLLHLRTNAYAAVFDADSGNLTRLGALQGSSTYAAAASQRLPLDELLPNATLRLNHEGKHYTWKIVADPKDHANYPVRLIDGGRWLHRFDFLALQFQDEAGNTLDGGGRLEIAAWPGHFTAASHLNDAPALEGARLELTVEGKVVATSTSEHPLVLGWPGAPQVDPANVRVFAATQPDTALSVRSTPWGIEVELPEVQWDMASNLDRLDRFPVSIVNPTDKPIEYPLVFTFDGSFQGVTGMSPMLRLPNDEPSGIPVQISKNWHRLPDQRLIHEGPWFHGATMITVPAHGEWRGEFAIAYARWGGVPAASHAQLSLVGWGGNQRWDQAAIGSFGESICYDPDVGLNRFMIDDVRPLMVRGMQDQSWQWTHNVGGGDFLVYFSPDGQKHWMRGVNTAYLSQGPNLTRVVYAGESDDGKLAMRAEVSTPRCDDINRAYHRVRYEVREPASFSRFVFYQLGADNYNDHQFTRIAVGNIDGLIEEWETPHGGKEYLRASQAIAGEAPWMALLGGMRSPQLAQGAWADRTLVVRNWNARLGGKDVPLPHFAVYGTENGVPSANVELVPPASVTELLPGDFVEFEVELLVLPQAASDYYGPNESFGSVLQEKSGTWQLAQHLARVGKLKIATQSGTLLRNLPIEIQLDGSQTAEFTVSGGDGFIPISFTGLPNPSGFSLTIDGKPMDQSVHGNDFWQCLPSEDGNGYTQTYNLLLDGASHRFRFGPNSL